MKKDLVKYEWIAQLPSDTTFVVFDTETTGLSPNDNRVIEIGAIRFHYKKELEEFDYLINPETVIPYNITKLTSITNDMVKNAPTAKDIVPKFLEFIGDAILIAHNASFDINFINAELARLSLPPLTNKVIDTRYLAQALFTKETNYKLQTLAESFKIEVLAAHRANDDSRVCMKLFLICIRELYKEIKPVRKEKLKEVV